MPDVATLDDLKQWDSDALAGAPASENPAVPETVATTIVQDTEHYHVNRAQDVEPYLDHVKELANTGQAWSPSGEMLHLAEFPAVIVERYCNEKGITFQDFMSDPGHVKAMLVDPSLSYFKVWDNVAHKSYR